MIADGVHIQESGKPGRAVAVSKPRICKRDVGVDKAHNSLDLAARGCIDIKRGQILSLVSFRHLHRDRDSAGLHVTDCRQKSSSLIAERSEEYYLVWSAEVLSALIREEHFFVEVRKIPADAISGKFTDLQIDPLELAKCFGLDHERRHVHDFVVAGQLLFEPVSQGFHAGRQGWSFVPGPVFGLYRHGACHSFTARRHSSPRIASVSKFSGAFAAGSPASASAGGNQWLSQYW